MHMTPKQYWIVAARRQFPNKPIVLQKIDLKSIYRRCHLNAVTAVKTITQLTEDELCIIMLHLTFGGAPCPFEWNIISESIRDLANAIFTMTPGTQPPSSHHVNTFGQLHPVRRRRQANR
jgi:hypothetical protein